MKKIYQQIESYLEYCELVRAMSPVTMRTKRYTLYDFVRMTGISNIKKLDNRMFDLWVMKNVKRGVSARAVNMYGAVVIAMVRYYKELGLNIALKTNLIKKIKETHIERKFYTNDEIMRVVAGADYETGLMIEIMFETGMRIAELTELKVGSFEGRKVKFIGKGRKLREVYIEEKTYELMGCYLEGRKKKEYLWGKESFDGMPPTVNTIRNRLRRVFNRAGLDGFYPHALRHSFATNLQMKGATVMEIKEMMGHESIATTERYLHGFDGKLKELFEKYR